MSKPLENLCVLIADDNDQAVRYYRMILKGLGIGTTLVAYNGRDACELLDKAFSDDDPLQIDAVICDWILPEVEGISILRHVRTVCPRLPFIMVTGIAEKSAVIGAISNGVSAYIAKPFAPDELEKKFLAVINTALESAPTDNA